MKRKYVAALAAIAVLAVIFMFASSRVGTAQTARQEAGSDELTPVSVVAEPTPLPQLTSSAPSVAEPEVVVEESPLPQAELNRLDCDAIRGTSYQSEAEAEWYRANCQGNTSQAQAPALANSATGQASNGAQAYIGCWSGKSWTGNGIMTLDVKTATDTRLTAVYTFPGQAPANHTYNMQPNGSIVAISGVFSWSLAGGTLNGTRVVGGVTNQAVMVKCGTAQSEPQPAPKPAPQPVAPPPAAPPQQPVAPPPTPKPPAQSVNQAWLGCWKGTYSPGGIQGTFNFTTATATQLSGTYSGITSDGRNLGSAVQSYRAQTNGSYSGTGSSATESLRISPDGQFIEVTRTATVSGDIFTATLKRC